MAQSDNRLPDATPRPPSRFALPDGSPDLSNSKVRNLLQAAERLFLETPYDAVSTDAIAKEAKVSKATLYVYFESKDALFATFVSSRCNHIAEHVRQFDTSRTDVESGLRQIAISFIEMLAGPKALGLYRSIVSQSIRLPELGRLFYEAGPKRFQAQLVYFLQKADRLGLLRVPDPELASIQFINLIAGEIPMRSLLALEATAPADHEANIEGGILLFMAGYGVKL